MSRITGSLLFATLAIVAVHAPAAGQTSPISVCVVENGQLREVRADYNRTTGDTTVAGVPFSRAHPMGAEYGASQAWYINNEPIEVSSTRYVKYGLPRVLGVNEVTRVAVFQQVPVFAEAGTLGTPEVVYLPVRVGCEFQPYQMEITEFSYVRDFTPIQFGQTITSGFDEDDRHEFESYFEDFLFRGREGQTLVIEMRSEEVDTYLTLFLNDDGELVEIDSNDDGFEEGTDSRLVVELPVTGEYIIRTSTFYEDELGEYTLSLREEGSKEAVAPMPISLGQSVTGRLDHTDPVLADDSHYDEYVYVAQAGERVRITLVSSDFDAYLTVGRRMGGVFSEIGSNDDGPNMDTDSRLTITFDRAGEYIIRANSLSGGETGAYTLLIRPN